VSIDKPTLLHSATDQFMRLGIKSVSMDDLSNNLGISKKTLYQIVDNKKDLVRLCIENHLGMEKQLTDDISKRSIDALDEMIQIGHHTVLAIRNIKPTMLHDLQKYYPDSWRLIRSFTREVIGEKIKNNLANGIQEGLYREDIRTDIISRLYVLKSWSLVDENNFPLRDFELDVLIRQHLLYHLSGILSDSGREQLNKYQLF
jgi:AcrR family transcriptional regulator